VRKRHFWLFIAVCFVLTFSTVSAGDLKVDKKELKNLPEVHQIEGLKPIRQGHQECGPTSMAMVMNFWGVEITKDELWKEVKSPYGEFTNCTDMQKYFYGHGFDTKVMSTKKHTNLKYFLYKGYPLIAFTESRRFPGEGHYIVLIGYTKEGFNIIDPGPGAFDFLTYEYFEKLHSFVVYSKFSKFGNQPQPLCGPFWTLVVCPK
jgi:ABC-type bacteriocin/lantibiotic exporter with double-glycine peptidase domain